MKDQVGTSTAAIAIKTITVVTVTIRIVVVIISLLLSAVILPRPLSPSTVSSPHFAAASPGLL